jgi:hypothetical protein
MVAALLRLDNLITLRGEVAISNGRVQQGCRVAMEPLTPNRCCC